MSRHGHLARYFLQGAAAPALLLTLQVAHAQQPSDTSPGSGPEEVVVTGSRLRQATVDTPNPTVSINSESIQLSGTTNLTSYLTDQPALVGSMDSTQTTGAAGFIGSTGLNLLDLRNLGTERTLVLVDGRRHVGQLPETAAVDVNTIPIDLIERIDVATGGVSAVYGADAVSGVVNFVMKKNFEGFTTRVQYGETSGGKPANWHAALTGGFNFADGRGNLSGSFEHTREGRLRAADRSYLRGTNYRTLQRNPDDPGDDPAIPDEVPLNDMRFFDSSREGGVDVDFDGVPDLRPNGAPYEVTRPVPPFFTQGGTGTPLADYIGDVLAKTENSVASAFMQFAATDSLNLFAEAKYAHGKSQSSSQPTFDYFIYLTPENPFLSAPILAAAPEGVLVNRDNFDLGVRAEDNTRDTWRTVVGLDGNISDEFTFELSYVFGQTEVDSVSINNRFNDRFFAALDVVADPATGRPVCRSNLDPTALPTDNFDYDSFGPGGLSFTPGANSGCLPLNILGEGVADAAAVDWVMTNSLATSKITQNVVTGFVSGDIPQIALPGGPIGVVVGAEWRRETSRSTPPAEDQAGLTFGNVIFPTRGEFDVKEAFTEVRLPLLKDRPFFDLLQLTGAVRVSDYSTVGSTTTWNVGATWAPVEAIAFRGTIAQSVRAPNISELFNPQSQTFLFIDDPCDATQLNNGSQFRAANCAAILTALGKDPATFEDPNSASIAGITRGNTGLSEETAESWTVGTVFRPAFAAGLSVAVDLYDITINDAISTPDAQTIANNCVDQPSIDNVFCAALTRDPGTAAIDSFIVQPANVANFRTRGVDFNVNYELDPAALGVRGNAGKFRVTLAGNHLDELTFIQTPGADVEDDRTTKYAPKWQSSVDLAWFRGPFTVNYGFNYFSKTKRYTLANLAGDPDLASPENINFDARKTQDLQVAMNLRDHVGVYAGVNNLTDQRPDLDRAYPVSPIGRFFYFGAKMNFAGR